MPDPPATPLAPYDVVLLGSFGGPEAPDEVMPFLRRVTAGRDIPEARLAGGRRALLRPRRSQPDQRPQPRTCSRALRAELDRRGSTSRSCGATATPSRSSPTRVRRGARPRRRRVSSRCTSAYSCYSSCRQYREDLAAAVEEVGPAADGLVVDKVRPYAVHPGFGARLAPGPRRGAPVPARPLDGAAPLRHALRPGGDGRHVRSRGRRGQPLRRPAPPPRPVGSPTRSTAELGLQLTGELVFCSRSGPAHPALARARRQRPHRGARRRG